MRFAGLDAVTIDGYGTLVHLRDPVPALRAALRDIGVERTREEVAAGFAAEARHSRPRSWRAGDESTLQELRSECVGVFLAELGVDAPPESFVPAFVGSLRFEPAPSAEATIRALTKRGLRLAVVANWDCGLHRILAELGLAPLFDAVVASADIGVEKPDPQIFRVALDRLGVDASRALHVGDEPVDEQGARAAGMRYAPAPLATAFEGWT
jgi:putative hydrolase of the HAD superfamily